MPDRTEVVDWARTLASRLEADMHWTPGDAGYGGYWEADEPELKSAIRARAIGALDFLDRAAGSQSQWAARAQHAFDNQGERQSMESGARAVGSLLLEWAGQVEAGMVTPRIVEASSAREVATADLMGQVRRLNTDQEVHPAAPVLLAAAALELALRTAVEELALDPLPRPSISTLVQRLRDAGVLVRQDAKNAELIAGLRNSAAHGEFNDLDRRQAVLLEQQVTMFLDRLEERLRAGLADGSGD
jgi:hypothetical protein